MFLMNVKVEICGKNLKICGQDTASAVRAFPNGTRMRLMECSD